MPDKSSIRMGVEMGGKTAPPSREVVRVGVGMEVGEVAENAAGFVDVTCVGVVTGVEAIDDTTVELYDAVSTRELISPEKGGLNEVLISVSGRKGLLTWSDWAFVERNFSMNCWKEEKKIKIKKG
jgi:hypothetical protein